MNNCVYRRHTYDLWVEREREGETEREGVGRLALTKEDRDDIYTGPPSVPRSPSLSLSTFYSLPVSAISLQLA